MSASGDGAAYVWHSTEAVGACLALAQYWHADELRVCECLLRTEPDIRHTRCPRSGIQSAHETRETETRDSETFQDGSDFE
jgi:hypothetical protein